MKPKITTIINYCSQDYRFLSLCVNEVKKFSQSIVIPVCSHFFDGSPEDLGLLQQSYLDHPECHFIQFDYSETDLYGLYPVIDHHHRYWPHYWHSVARYVGYHFLSPETEYTMFIDVDEIFDGDRFGQWLENFSLNRYGMMRFSSYFYFRDPCYRMKEFTLNALMVKNDKPIPETSLLSIAERKGLYVEFEGKKIENVVDDQGIPFVHHYSWVRTQEELFKKVQRWGHSKEGNFKALLLREFADDFRGFDCVYGKEYERVVPVHDPLGVAAGVSKSALSNEYFPNVTYVNPTSLFKISIKNLALST